MAEAIHYLANNRIRKSLLFLVVVLIFQHVHGSEKVEPAPWIPPHITNERDSSTFYSHLMPLIWSDLLFLASSVSLELARLVSYRLLAQVSTVETAWFTADTITRLMDAAIDYSLSEDYGDFALRALFSNIDKLPWFRSNSGYSRIARRTLVYLYIFRRHIARYLPEYSHPRKPSSIYLHAPLQDKMLHIVLVPPSGSAQYDPTTDNESYFILSRKESDFACDPAKAKPGDVIDEVIHQLNCQPSVRVHLYPQKWQGKNRLFIRVFRGGLAGSLYLSPFSYGDASNTDFFSELIDRIEETKAENSTFKSKEGNYIANPLDERTFLLLRHLIEQRADDSPVQQYPPPSLKDSMADAYLLEPQEPASELISGQTIETETLSLISGGHHSFLVLDQGDGKSGGPVISFETRYGLESVEQGVLEQIEQHRAEQLSDHWWLTFEATHLLAMQLLSGLVQKQFNKHYAMPLKKKISDKLSDVDQGKVRQAPVQKENGANPKQPFDGGKHPNKSSQRTKKPSWKLRDDDNSDMGRPKHPQNHRKARPHQSTREDATAIKKARGRRGEQIVTLAANEPESTLRKRHQQPGADSARASQTTVFSPVQTRTGRVIRRPRRYIDTSVSDAGSDKEPEAKETSMPDVDPLWAYDTSEKSSEEACVLAATSTSAAQPEQTPGTRVRVFLPDQAETQTKLQELGIQPGLFPTTIIIKEESTTPTRFRAGETEGGIPCPVIGCCTKHGIHTRYSSYDYWWGHIKAHAGITYDGEIFVTSQAHGVAIMAKQKGFRCQFAQCVKTMPAFASLKLFGEHLAAEHAQELDQQKFNPYQTARLLSVAGALGIQVSEGDSPFIVGQSYRCGIQDCDYAVIYRNDQGIYKDLVEHRNAEHRAIKIGKHKPGPDFSKMIDQGKHRFFLAKKYQTRMGLGWFCTKCQPASLAQFPEAVGRHYKYVHLEERIYCPVKDCNHPETNERCQFLTLQDLYAHHMRVHQPAYLNSLMAEDQIRSEHSYCTPSQSLEIRPEILADGWVKPEDIDLFMLEWDLDREALAPGETDFDEYEPDCNIE